MCPFMKMLFVLIKAGEQVGWGNLGLCSGPTVYVLCASRSKHFSVIVRLVTLHLVIPTLSQGSDCVAVWVYKGMSTCVYLCVCESECVGPETQLVAIIASVIGFEAKKQISQTSAKYGIIGFIH